LGVVVAAVVMAAAAVGAAFAVDTVGYVNVQEVFQGYDRTTKSNAELDALSKSLVAKLQVLEENMLLSHDDLEELVVLRTKANISDSEKGRMKSLQDKEIGLEKELADLSAKKEPTSQEQARLKELQDRKADAKVDAEKIRDDSEKMFKEKSKELSAAIRDDIVKAIEAVAKDKKLNVIVDKEAVLYGGVDVTKDVLSKLKK
jgi:Skp family chaperone for outer membrane proteins